MKKTVDLFCLRSLQGGYTRYTDYNLAEGSCGHQYVLLGTATAEFEMVADKDQVTAAVAALEKSKEVVRAEMQQRLNRIDGEIQNLLALTHEVQA